MTTVYRDGVAVELTDAERIALEATLPAPKPKLETTDDTFKEVPPWQSLTA